MRKIFELFQILGLQLGLKRCGGKLIPLTLCFTLFHLNNIGLPLKHFKWTMVIKPTDHIASPVAAFKLKRLTALVYIIRLKSNFIIALP